MVFSYWMIIAIWLVVATLSSFDKSKDKHSKLVIWLAVAAITALSISHII